MATVLTILPEGFEELEAVAPIDVWRRAGLKVRVAALANQREVTGRNGLTLRADTTLGNIAPDTTYDLLFLPGGPGVVHLRASPEVREIIGRQVAADKWIAAICAAPLVLKDAGLLAGRRYTAHPSAETELGEIDASQAVITDGRIITSRGAGTALALGLHVVELLLGKEKAQEISLSICAEGAS
jgi:4-methyl-5(b-hydroxyethyl)-thiazole monophosphate biosynthesis